jgi:hypothetical protein
MFDTSSLCRGVTKGSASAALALLVAACAAPEPGAEQASQPAAPQASAQERAAAREAQRAKLAVEARALVAQAETDVQRARAKRALWLGAWEDLVGAREALVGNDYARAIARAKHASELAELGLEQLAYPAVK